MTKNVAASSDRIVVVVVITAVVVPVAVLCGPAVPEPATAIVAELSD